VSALSALAFAAFVVALVNCGVWSFTPWIALIVCGFFGRMVEAN
jgi:hypothetical protein